MEQRSPVKMVPPGASGSWKKPWKSWRALRTWLWSSCWLEVLRPLRPPPNQPPPLTWPVQWHLHPLKNPPGRNGSWTTSRSCRRTWERRWTMWPLWRRRRWRLWWRQGAAQSPEQRFELFFFFVLKNKQQRFKKKKKKTCNVTLIVHMLLSFSSGWET